MKLDKPISFFDLETTGTDPKTARIVEISILKMVSEDEHYEVKTARVNPGIPIPSEATNVHGITDDMVKDCPPFKRIARGIMDYLSGSDIAGFNSNSYDIPLLYAEFNRAGLTWDYTGVQFIDVCNIFKRQFPRDLSSAYKHYCGKELKDAHSSEADVIATMEVFNNQLNGIGTVADIAKYSNYDKEIVDLGGCFSKDADGEYIFNFGKNKGKKCKEDYGYLQWMLKNDFLPDALKICKTLING